MVIKSYGMIFVVITIRSFLMVFIVAAMPTSALRFSLVSTAGNQIEQSYNAFSQWQEVGHCSHSGCWLAQSAIRRLAAGQCQNPMNVVSGQ